MRLLIGSFVLCGGALLFDLFAGQQHLVSTEGFFALLANMVVGFVVLLCGPAAVKFDSGKAEPNFAAVVLFGPLALGAMAWLWNSFAPSKSVLVPIEWESMEPMAQLTSIIAIGVPPLAMLLFSLAWPLLAWLPAKE